MKVLPATMYLRTIPLGTYAAMLIFEDGAEFRYDNRVFREESEALEMAKKYAAELNRE